MDHFQPDLLPVAVLELLPNPILIKSSALTYVWANRAFQDLFSVKADELVGKSDIELFPMRQAAQCNGGDLRVLETGDIDEAYEEVYSLEGEARQMITRKSRLEVADGSVYLLGIMHDITAVTDANASLVEAQDELRRQATVLQELADTDHLTQCLNRRAFLNEVAAHVDTTVRESALMVLDLDHFKRINDSYGHDAGDEALLRFTDVVRDELRDGDVLGRIGGEEFVVLLRGCGAEEAQKVAERIRSTVAATEIDHDGSCFSFTVSIGAIVRSATSTPDVSAWLRDADRLLYEAKTAGRNRVVLG